MMNKKGLSGIVTVVILVALSVALVAVVWGVVQNMVESNLEQAGACSSLFTEEVVSINSDYTCYDGTDIYFAVNVGDVDIDAILVKVEGRATSRTYKIDPTASFPSLKLYTGQEAYLPEKNSGLTYNLSTLNGDLSGPYNIGISPIIDGHTCDEINRINAIDNCNIIVDFP